MTAPSLTTQTARGALWNTLGTTITHGSRLLALVVVAWYLTPAEVAIGGLAMVAMGLFRVLSVQGFAQGLVRLESVSSVTVHSVFWPIVSLSLILGVVMVGTGGLMAKAYAEPALIVLMPWVALGLVLSMASAVPLALLQRGMRFFHINVIQVISHVLASGLMVLLAVTGFSFYAMVIPSVFGFALVLVGSLVATRYVPHFRFSGAEFRKVRTFGLAQLGANILGYFSDNGDYLILGRFWPRSTFGYYYFAFERAVQPFAMIYAQFSSVLYATYSKVNTNHPALRAAYLRSTQLLCIVTYPMYVILIGYADLLIPLLFGPQWTPAVPIFQAFSTVAFLRTFAGGVPAMMLALDRAQYNFYFNAFRVAALAPTLVFLCTQADTLTEAAWLLVLVWHLQSPVYILAMYRMIDLPIYDVWKRVQRIVIATVGMAVIVATTRQWLPVILENFDLHALPLALIGCTAACLVFLLIAREELTEALRYIITAVKAPRPSA